jgi:hypothetical protein
MAALMAQFIRNPLEVRPLERGQVFCHVTYAKVSGRE